MRHHHHKRETHKEEEKKHKGGAGDYLLSQDSIKHLEHAAELET